MHSDKYYRLAGLAALRWLTECRDGQLSMPGGRLFDIGFIDYAVDAERILSRHMTHFEWWMLMCVHRDGLAAEVALGYCCHLLPERMRDVVASLDPVKTLEKIESKLGRIIICEGLVAPLSC